VRASWPSDVVPAEISAPAVNCSTALTTNTPTASDSPSGPKANKHSGRPMLPVLANISAGRKLRRGNPVAHSTAVPTAANTPIDTAVANANRPKAVGSGSSRVSASNTSAGVPILNTRRVTIGMSKGAPSRPQTRPSPAVIATGAMIVSSSAGIGSLPSMRRDRRGVAKDGLRGYITTEWRVAILPPWRPRAVSLKPIDSPPAPTQARPMTGTADQTQLAHATTVALSGVAVVLRGPPGAGKSDLALRLIDRGALLVADDQTVLAVRDGALWASAPTAIAGRIEVRGLGIVPVPASMGAQVAVLADLVAADRIERLPEPATEHVLGIALPRLALAPFEASATAKLRLAARLAARRLLPLRVDEEAAS